MQKRNCVPGKLEMRIALWILSLPLLAAGLNGEELAPWNSNRHESDVSNRHVQEVTEPRQEYAVVQGGAMDGRNCRSPQGVWTPFEQTWESNRAVRMENIGETDVVNPWLSNGRNDFRSVGAMVARAVTPGMTDKEKAAALWWQQVQHRFHYQGDNRELLSPVKVFNIYGHNTCGNDSICMAGLWKTVGLKVAPARLVGHCVTQVFYDGAWHLFDGDMHSIYLLRDNETIAGEQDLVRDHDLIRRTHTQGILRQQGRAGDEWASSIYVFEGDVIGDRNADQTSAMNMTLRPGEALVWRWGHTEPPKYFGSPEHRFSERICNGLWEYRPDFTNATWRKGADSVEEIVSAGGGLQAEQGKTGVVVWTIRSPYVMVGGELDFEGCNPKFEISWDGQAWESVGSDLDSLFPPTGTARYSYQLRCQLAGDATLRSLGITNDLQMAPLSLPEMGVGENQFTYSDESPSDRRVRITHAWVERSASRPPLAPPAPISPPDQGEIEVTGVVFQWRPPSDPDGERIADYHFELSSRPDMKWPLSMSFAKLISRTSDAGAARYTLGGPGELNPDRQYYWHVRAKDAQGVWGPWSETWSFTSRGPAPPLAVAVEYDSERNLGMLRWTPNPMGRRPVAYRIYASDEKGFFVSDEPFETAGGIYDFDSQTATKAPTQFPANFVTETGAMELPVLGPSVDLAGANKAYYRVVAVDEKGNRSGPSDYAAAPRPLIFSKPVTQTTMGRAYAYDVRVLRSIGDLRMRFIEGREVLNYWDVEKPRFRLQQGPSWLRIDAATGRLRGKPDRPGRSEVTVAVTLEREERRLDPAQLQWGVEKVIETRIETVGTATQRFVIETAP
jgi:hypothetical protein